MSNRECRTEPKEVETQDIGSTSGDWGIRSRDKGRRSGLYRLQLPNANTVRGSWNVTGIVVCGMLHALEYQLNPHCFNMTSAIVQYALGSSQGFPYKACVYAKPGEAPTKGQLKGQRDCYLSITWEGIAMGMWKSK